MNTLQKFVDGPSVAVAATSLGGELMSVVFNFYYVKVFLNLYHLEDTWLNIAQILFLVWNAINDPLFGYIQDFGCGNFCKWITKRRKVILYFGPVFSLIFLVPWIPWSYGSPHWLVGFHLLTSLFLYDAMVSLVLSAQCGLFTELSTEHKDRVRVVVYMEIAGLLASFVIFPVDKFSDSLENYRNFQICCAVLALLSLLCFVYTGLMAPKGVAQIEQIKANDLQTKTKNPTDISSKKADQPVTRKTSIREGLRSCKEIFLNRDFVSVVFGNFFHIMRAIGDANFLAIFTEALISPNYATLAIGTTLLSAFYTACNAVPKLFLFLCWPLLQRFGAWALTMLTAILSVINCLVIYFVGRQNYVALAIFFLIEFVLSRSLWPAVYNIFFPDIIDEDMNTHERNHPLSTLIFTLNALVTKPAISVAPIVIVRFLRGSNYQVYVDWTQAIKKNQTPNATATFTSNATAASTGMLPPTAMPEAQLDNLFDNMFLVACFYPMVCCLLEVICLLPYRLKFRHKRDACDGRIVAPKEA